MVSHNESRNGSGSNWLVLKFGGSSVSSFENWQTITSQAATLLEQGHHVLIVVSALNGVTDQLQQLAAAGGDEIQLLSSIRKQHVDLLADNDLEPGLAFESYWKSLEDAVAGTQDSPQHRLALLQSHGELLSSCLGQQVLANTGLDANLQYAPDLLEAVDAPGSDRLSARCMQHSDPNLRERLEDQGSLHITQGFLAGGPDGKTWLLGRGGSDTSAALFAARLQAEQLQIWTDVPGVFSADPRIVSDARLLHFLSYSEAQEFAAMGAKVLHPGCIDPVRRHGIPVVIKDTRRPDATGTHISPRSAETDGQVKGVVSRKGITLVNMESFDMWHQVGFLADAFAVFKRHQLSIDLISTSESSVTVSLDPSQGTRRLEACIAELELLCKLQVLNDCTSISLVGNAIRTILGSLSEALDVFQDRRVHMVTQSANDLNLTLVVDSAESDRLVQKLHRQLITSDADQNPIFGERWSVIARRDQSPQPEAWWRREAQGLLQIMQNRSSAFVYDLDTVRAAARGLLAMRSISRVLYAVKANSHVSIIKALHAEGTGFECVSMAEVNFVMQTVGEVEASDILFTPNFARREELSEALETGVCLTIDNDYPLHNWPELFAGHELFLRIDIDVGHGHNRKVITSGARSKFGISMSQLELLRPQLEQHDIMVTGLHVHTGSGVNEADVWVEQLQALLQVVDLFPTVKVLDLGGGLGVPERAGQSVIDLQAMDRVLGEMVSGLDIELWLEPGRYLVAEAGVLLSKVTQLKSKGTHHYLGLDTGMNSLIRPALYGAYHDIINLTRANSASSHRYTVVGPICESGDVLGHSRYLPESREGDVMLIANAGAYGRVMSSNYNMREPAEELIYDIG